MEPGGAGEPGEAWEGIPGLAAFRAVPGVGRARAELLIRHLWEAGAGADFPGRMLEWESIDGIGPVTAAALERAFPSRDLVVEAPAGSGGERSLSLGGAGEP